MTESAKQTANESDDELFDDTTAPDIHEADFPLVRKIIFKTKPGSWPKDSKDKLTYEMEVTFPTIKSVVDAAEKYVKWTWQGKARDEKITNDKVHKFTYGKRIKT